MILKSGLSNNLLNFIASFVKDLPLVRQVSVPRLWPCPEAMADLAIQKTSVYVMIISMIVIIVVVNN